MEKSLRNRLDDERNFLLDRIKEIKDSIEEGGDSSIDILKFILENTTDGYWDWYITKDYEYLSPTFKKQLGYEDHEMENHPSSWQKLANPDDLKILYGIVAEHFESKGKKPIIGTVRYKHKDGHDIKILCRGKVVEWGDNNEPIRMVGTHTIIEDTKNK